MDAEATPLPQTLDAAQAEILRLRETNRSLNKRANGEDARWMRRALRAERDVETYRALSNDSFDRMLRAHEELRRVYLAVLESRGDARPKFHSVMDCNVQDAEGFNADGRIYANIFTPEGRRTPEGPVLSIWILDAVKAALDGGQQAPAEESASSGTE